jgi:hypothetical protein
VGWEVGRDHVDEDKRRQSPAYISSLMERINTTIMKTEALIFRKDESRVEPEALEGI